MIQIINLPANRRERRKLFLEMWSAENKILSIEEKINDGLFNSGHSFSKIFNFYEREFFIFVQKKFNFISVDKNHLRSFYLNE